MDLEPLSSHQVIATRARLVTISSMVREPTSLRMEIGGKESGRMGRRTATVDFMGLMDEESMESGWMTNYNIFEAF